MEGRRWWPAAVVVGLIVTLGLILTAAGLLGGGGGAAPPSAFAASPTPAQDTSVCGLPDVALSGSLEKAPSAKWSLVGTIAAPTVDGQGPGRVDADGFRSCFAHTPSGAVVAAANIAALKGRA